MDPLSVRAADPAACAEAEALLVLQGVPGLGDVGVKRLLDAFGSGRGALAAPDRELADALADGIPRPAHHAIARARGGAPHRQAARDALAAADALGMCVVPIGAAAYPSRLLDLVDPPPLLFLRGRTELLSSPAVAVVGSRRATGYGRRTAGWLAGGLARGGVVVLSGLALGVDGEAHRGALAAGGGTVAVLGAGADVEHPPTQARLQRTIAREGLLVSEFPPGTLPLPHHFPRRNRLMAALARAVVVVEAAMRSGALITARLALDLGREVLAVPGPIDVPTSAGANALLGDGAAPALCPDVILRAIGIESEPVAPAAPPPGTDRAAVWDALAGRPVEVDDLAGRAGLSAPRALAALSLLELEGWAVRSAGGRFARKR